MRAPTGRWAPSPHGEPLSAGAERGLRLLTGRPAGPGWPCGRERQRQWATRDADSGCTPSRLHSRRDGTYLGSMGERHGSLSAQQQKHRITEERKATFTTQIPLSFSLHHHHKTQEHHQKLNVGQNFAFNSLSGFCLKVPWTRREATLGSPPPVPSMTLEPGDQCPASHAVCGGLEGTHQHLAG